MKYFVIVHNINYTIFHISKIQFCPRPIATVYKFDITPNNNYHSGVCRPMGMISIRFENDGSTTESQVSVHCTPKNLLCLLESDNA